jgi:glutaminyl-peptide cyclotransferase
VGSPQGRETADYITAELRKVGWAVEQQDFEYRGVSACNLVAAKGTGPLFIIGAHYDTRSLAERDLEDPTLAVPGANDGASGVAVLLELARVLDLEKSGIQVWLAFFDAEDQGGINGWPFSVGASYMAEHLTAQPVAVVVVDMVGDQEQEIFWERNSDAALQRELWAIAADLGYEAAFVPQYRYSIMDDHVPFIQRGLVAVDIIDFDYPYWHTSQDTPDKVSPTSLQRVGRVVETWLEEGP